MSSHNGTITIYLVAVICILTRRVAFGNRPSYTSICGDDRVTKQITVSFGALDKDDKGEHSIFNYTWSEATDYAKDSADHTFRVLFEHIGFEACIDPTETSTTFSCPYSNYATLYSDSVLILSQIPTCVGDVFIGAAVGYEIQNETILGYAKDVLLCMSVDKQHCNEMLNDEVKLNKLSQIVFGSFTDDVVIESTDKNMDTIRQQYEHLIPKLKIWREHFENGTEADYRGMKNDTEWDAETMPYEIPTTATLNVTNATETTTSTTTTTTTATNATTTEATGTMPTMDSRIVATLIVAVLGFGLQLGGIVL